MSKYSSGEDYHDNSLLLERTAQAVNVMYYKIDSEKNDLLSMSTKMKLDKIRDEYVNKVI